MAEQLYRVVFEGEILEGREVQEVKIALAKLYKSGEDQIERFFSGKRLAVKKDVDYDTAMKYVKAFERAGAVCRVEELEAHASLEQPLMLEKDVEKPSQEELEPHTGLEQPLTPEKDAEKPSQEALEPHAGLGQPLTLEKESEKPSQQDGIMVCPKCQFEQEPSEECLRCGIIVSKYSERFHAPESERKTEGFAVETQPSGSKLLPISVLLLVVFLAVGFYYFSGTPRYSLYKIGRAFKNHDAEEFHKYVDVDRIVDHLAEFALEHALAEMEANQPTGDWGRPSQEFDKELAMMMFPQMIEALKPQIKQAITELIEDTGDDREGSPFVGASLADIQTEGNTSLVTVEDEETGQEIRFKMEKSSRRYWRIVEIDFESFQSIADN